MVFRSKYSGEEPKPIIKTVYVERKKKRKAPARKTLNDPKDIRKKLLDMFENKCSRCGYKGPALEFHHEDPNQKKFVLNGQGLQFNDIESIMAELAKCVLLCRNCHCEVHQSLS